MMSEHEFFTLRYQVKLLAGRVTRLENDLSLLTAELLKVFQAIVAIGEKTDPADSGETNKQTKS